MNLLINGESHSLDISPEATFGEVMLAVNRLKSSPGVGLINVRLNGEDITGADWSRFSTLVVAGIEALEVQTGQKSALARELLDSVEDFTGRLISELGRAAEAYRQGDCERASQIYVRALDGVQLLSHTTGMIERNLGFDASTIRFGGRPSTEQLRKLAPMIDDMMSAQQKEDWVLLADLIEYELVPQFEDHQKVLKLWREAVDANA